MSRYNPAFVTAYALRTESHSGTAVKLTDYFPQVPNEENAVRGFRQALAREAELAQAWKAQWRWGLKLLLRSVFVPKYCKNGARQGNFATWWRSAVLPPIYSVAFRFAAFGAVTLLLTLNLSALGMAFRTTEEQALTKGEERILAKLRLDQEADLKDLPEKEQHVKAEFLNRLLFGARMGEVGPSGIRIKDAIVDGLVSTVNHNAIQHQVSFVNMKFGGLDLSDARFDEDVAFTNCTTTGQMSFDRIHLKGNLNLKAVRTSPGSVAALNLNNARIEGNLLISNADYASIFAHGVTAVNVWLVVEPSRLRSINLSSTTAEHISIQPEAGRPGPQPHLAEIDVRQAKVASSFSLSIDVDALVASQLHVTNDAIVSSWVGTADFAQASADALGWTVADNQQVRWPQSINIDGLTFGAINVAATPSTKLDPFPKYAKWRFPRSEGRALEFLNRAQFSESTYQNYEAALRRRGAFAEADNVYSAMRDRKRRAVWENSKGAQGKARAAVYWVVDEWQWLFLGYGRTPTPPLFCSFVIVGLGTLLYRNNGGKRMESYGERPPKYSSFWYSLEIFLPVADFGMAKNWRPRQGRFLTCARLQQLLGWVLIPAILAAITGLAR